MSKLRVLIDIGHPGHVHLYRNIYHELVSDGHKVWVTVKDIPIMTTLLEKYGMDYTVLGKKVDSLIGKAITQLKYNFLVARLVKKNQINIGVGSSITLAHVSKCTAMKSVILDDDDDAVQPLFVKFAHPFADSLLSPSALIGRRKRADTIFYSGYHELAYLHPNVFKPDSSILKELHLGKEEPYFILRFNIFKAHHDVGVKGLDLSQKIELVNLLKSRGRILITTEREIEPALEKYQLRISPEKIHSLLYYASLFLGDSQTMASEAAILGTPSIRLNSLVGELALHEELELKYNLTYGFRPNDFGLLVKKVNELLESPNTKSEWQLRRNTLISEKIDTTSFLVWFIKNYPSSMETMRENPEYQLRFR
jgi:uncharacterized protein